MPPHFRTSNSIVYYGLSFLSSEMNDNIYLPMVLLSLVEVPGITLTAIAGERFSRKRVLVVLMSVGGVACIASSLIKSQAKLKMWLAVFGKMNIAGSFSLSYVYTAEIIPTVVRIRGLGMCAVFARIGGIVAPYLLKLVRGGHSSLVHTEHCRLYHLIRRFSAARFPFWQSAPHPCWPDSVAYCCRRPKAKSCPTPWTRWNN